MPSPDAPDAAGPTVTVRPELEEATLRLNQVITDGVGWWYVIAVNIFLGFSLYCAFSRIGLIRLPEICANICFGGVRRNQLFMCASQSLYVVPVEAQGAHFC